MKNRRLQFITVVAVIALLAGCSAAGRSASDALASSASSGNISGATVSTSSDSIPAGSASSSSQNQSSLPQTDENQLTQYALELAKYFREPVSSGEELKDNPHLYEFTINTLYAIYQKNAIPLENISGKDWFLQFNIPAKDMIKAANLLLRAELPEEIYTNPDFQYSSDTDSFLYSPWSPPMFHTKATLVLENSDATWSVSIEIMDAEEKILNTNIYVFKAIQDEQWGVLYQLLTIKPEAD